MRRDTPVQFHFEVKEACKVTLDTWEWDDESHSNTDIFIGANIDANLLNAENCLKKSTFGAERIDIYPDEEGYQLGLYRVVYSTRSKIAKLEACLSLQTFQSVKILNN